MRVTLRQKNLEVTPALSDFINSKLVKPLEKRLKKFEKLSPLLEIEVGRTTRHHHKGMIYHAEANLTLGGDLLRAEVDDQDIRTACDLLEKELLGELSKHLDKKRYTAKKTARFVKNVGR